MPTFGEVRVNGLTPHKDRKMHLRNIGVVFGQKSSLLVLSEMDAGTDKRAAISLYLRDAAEYLYRYGKQHRDWL